MYFSPAGLAADELPYAESRVEAGLNAGGTVFPAVHYRVWAPAGSGKTAGKVLLVHGLGGNTYSYRHTAPFLAEMGYFVVALDLPPFGFSGKVLPDSYTFGGMAELAWALIDTIDPAPEEPWTLVGHSMGGRVIAHMAEGRPEKTTGLVFLAGAVYMRSGGGSFAASEGGRKFLYNFLTKNVLTEKGGRRFLKSAYARKPLEDEVDGYRGAFLLPGTVDGFIDFSIATGASAPVDLSAIQAPSLLIWGTKDTWVPLKNGKKLLKDLKTLAGQPANLEIIKGAGHCPQETHPEIVNGLIADFLTPNF